MLPSPLRIGRRDLLRASRLRGSPYWLRVSRPAMACRFEITLPGEDAARVPAAHEALREATRLDETLSIFRGSSALSAVNRRAAEAPAPAGDEVFALLQACARLHVETEGAFDITSTPLSRCWGFLARQGRVPAPEALDAARALVGMSSVALDASTRTVRFARPGMELNLGSIGKGYAVERMAAILRARGVEHALVSAGGSSVRALGGRDGGWAIEVRSRASGQRPIATLRLHGAALATSGIGEQAVEPEGVRPAGGPSCAAGATPVRYGHVIDPRTGWPAQGLVSVSVVTADAARADALATAFLVGGADLAARYCASHPRTLALLTPEGADRPIVVGAHPGACLEDL